MKYNSHLTGQSGESSDLIVQPTQCLGERTLRASKVQEASPRSLGFRVAVHEEEEGAKDSPRQGGGPGAEPPERRRRAPAVTEDAALRHQGA